MHFGSDPLSAESLVLPSRLKALTEILRDVRIEADTSHSEMIYLSAGDEHTGTALDELLGYSATAFGESTGFAVQSALGLDAATIGNHDLDRGPAVLEAAIQQNAPFPLLSCNITHSAHLCSYYPAVVGQTPRGARVAIIGVTTDEQLQVREVLDPAFQIANPLDSAGRVATALLPRVDVCIVLSHLGLNVTGSRHTARVDDRLLAERLAQVTGEATGPDRFGPQICIIGGHTHTVIDPARAPVVVQRIPVFQAGCNLEHVGVVRISDRAIQGRLLSTATRSKDRSPHSQGLVALQRRSLEQLRARVGRSITRIEAHGTITTERVLEDRLSGECSMANMITDALRWHLLQQSSTQDETPVVVFVDASGIQSGHGQGTHLRVADLYRILPYADSLYSAEIAVGDLVKILRSNAHRRLPRTALAPHGGSIGLMDWAQISRGFLHFSENLRYQIADGAGGEIDGVLLEGQPVDSYSADRIVRIYGNSFSAMGNQGWGYADDRSYREFGAVSLPAMGFEDTGRPLRQVLIEALEHLPAVSICKDHRVTIHR